MKLKERIATEITVNNAIIELNGIEEKTEAQQLALAELQKQMELIGEAKRVMTIRDAIITARNYCLDGCDGFLHGLLEAAKFSDEELFDINGLLSVCVELEAKILGYDNLGKLPEK